MNTTASYTTTAQSTRSKGHYVTPAHLAAGRKLIGKGVTALTADELDTLATHPYMSTSQRSEFSRLAAQLR